ncbi:MAG: DUF393 domain-containing protein [Actinomycetota bacterium]
MFIYDGDCGFCTTTAAWAQRRLPPNTPVVPWQSLDLDEYGLSLDDVTTAAYWVDADGRTHRGYRAAAKGLLAMGVPWAPLGWVALRPPLKWPADLAYKLVARYRHRLPGSTDACRLDQARPPS